MGGGRVEQPLISVDQFCRRGTRTPATFAFAGMFVDADDYEKGNLDMNAKELTVGEEDDGT